MKRVLLAVAFGLMAIAAQAEATFDQIEGLIQQKQYAAAEQGLEVIIQNHPKSAKAFYAMAQAQAGLGNQEKAQKALNIATGLNPTLDFAPSSSVASLKEAITPQVKKIEAIEESHTLRNFVVFAMFAGFVVAMYFIYSVYSRKQEEEDAAEQARREAETRAEMARRAEESKIQWLRTIAEQELERKKEEAAEAALKAHPNYGHERFDPANPDKLKTVKQMKEEKAAAELREAKYKAEQAEARANEAEALARGQAAYARSAPAPTVIHTSSGSNDMLTGIMVGNMLSGSHHDHHDTTIIRETVLHRYLAAALGMTLLLLASLAHGMTHQAHHRVAQAGLMTVHLVALVALVALAGLALAATLDLAGRIVHLALAQTGNHNVVH
jgi:chemotaxis protein histidine kinase CheA